MTELAVYQPPTSAVAVPDHHDTDSWVSVVSEVIKVANVIFDTPFVPDGLRGSAAAVAAAILSGREMGLGPMTSLANIDVIKGRPTQKPLLMRAMILSRGHKWEDVENTDTRAVVRGCRKGESTWTTVTFTADQAKRAGIDLGKYPSDKLYARATSRLAKHRFADVIMGMASSDDVEDGLDDGIGVTTESGETAAAEQPEDKPRTAQRKPRATNASPVQAASPEAAEPPSGAPAQAGTGEALPPLPGEEEERPTGAAAASGSASTAAPASAETAPPDDTDYDTPGTATDPQVRAIVTILSKVFGVDSDEQSRAVCAHVAEREVTSRKNLSKNEAAGIIDTLSHWQKQAKKEEMDPRTYMFALMAAQEAAREQDEIGGGDGGE